MPASGALVLALTWPGTLELFEADEAILQPMKFDGLVLLSVTAVSKQIKGHQEKIWLIEGRVAPTAESRKVLQKAKPKAATLLEPAPLLLSVAQMHKLLDLQKLWLSKLENESSVSILARSEQDLSCKEGFLWKRESLKEMGYVPLWQEPIFETLVFEQVASSEEVQKSLSFLLRMISEIVKISELEMKGSLRTSSHPEMIDSWVKLFESAALCPLSLIEEERSSSKGELFWQIFTQEDNLTWWSLAQIKLTCLSAGKWRLEARPVTSFYRWMVASQS